MIIFTTSEDHPNFGHGKCTWISCFPFRLLFFNSLLNMAHCYRIHGRNNPLCLSAHFNFLLGMLGRLCFLSQRYLDEVILLVPVNEMSPAVIYATSRPDTQSLPCSLCLSGSCQCPEQPEHSLTYIL